MSVVNLPKLIGGLNNLGIEYLENELLRDYSSMKTGGVCDLIIFPKNDLELIALIDLFKKHGTGFFITGRGTNTLFKEDGTKIPVISFKKGFDYIIEADAGKFNDDNRISLKIGSGTVLSSVLNYALKKCLGGCEFFYGIPGSFGGAVRMNAGSKESTVGNILESIKIITENGETLEIGKNDLSFSYRDLKIKNMDCDFIITESVVSLHKSSREKIMEAMAVFKDRKSCQPLGQRSLGCIFKNPPGFSAGRIIDEMGLKGFPKGGARVSDKHANFIINQGKATSKDIIDLIEIIRKKASREKGIELNTEIKII